MCPTKTAFGLLVAMYLCSSGFGQERDSSYYIEGIISDPEISQPTNGAGVGIANTGLSAITDSNGYFRLDNLWPDTFVVSTHCFDGIDPFTYCRAKVVLSPDQRNKFLYLGLLGSYNTASLYYAVIPESWQMVDANGLFHFALPPEFTRDEGVHGIDSYVDRYSAKGMTVKFDFGMFEE